MELCYKCVLGQYKCLEGNTNVLRAGECVLGGQLCKASSSLEYSVTVVLSDSNKQAAQPTQTTSTRQTATDIVCSGPRNTFSVESRDPGIQCQVI